MQGDKERQDACAMERRRDGRDMDRGVALWQERTDKMGGRSDGVVSGRKDIREKERKDGDFFLLGGLLVMIERPELSGSAGRASS